MPIPEDRIVNMASTFHPMYKLFNSFKYVYFSLFIAIACYPVQCYAQCNSASCNEYLNLQLDPEMWDIDSIVETTDTTIENPRLLYNNEAISRQITFNNKQILIVNNKHISKYEFTDIDVIESVSYDSTYHVVLLKYNYSIGNSGCDFFWSVSSQFCKIIFIEHKLCVTLQNAYDAGSESYTNITDSTGETVDSYLSDEDSIVYKAELSLLENGFQLKAQVAHKCTIYNNSPLKPEISECLEELQRVFFITEDNQIEWR